MKAESATPEPSSPLAAYGGRCAFLAVACAVSIAAAVFVCDKAWVCEDAFITFRHVNNFLAGLGPVFNPGERVQGFSHPLWFLLLSSTAGMTGVYAAAIIWGIVLTAALFAVQAWLLRSQPHRFWLMLLIALALLSSKTFVEYQTSGLENSLSTFLLATLAGLLASRAVERRPLPTVGGIWLCSLIVLNRPDYAVLVGPVALTLAAHGLRYGPHRTRAKLLAALLPLLGWYGFATIYYGTPVPNPSYAKTVMTHVQAAWYGLAYLVDYTKYEPLQTFAILAATGLTARWLLAGSSRTLAAAMPMCLILGIWLYVAALVSVGGDYMTGRLLDAVMVIGVILAGWMIAAILPVRLSPCLPACVFAAWGLAWMGWNLWPAARQSCIVRGFEQLQYDALGHPWTVGGLVAVYTIGIVLFFRWIRHTSGERAACTFLGIALPLHVWAVGVIGFAQPAWFVPTGFIAAGTMIAAAMASCMAGQGRGHPLGSIAACLIVAGAFSLCDIGRSRESSDGVIQDEYTFYQPARWHNPWVHAEDQLLGAAHDWHRIGMAARRYAARFGPITLASEPLGIIGYYAGAQVYIIDLWGLTDPYLARSEAPPSIRAGHTQFRVPPGYLESRGAINLLPDWFARLEKLDPTLREQATEMAKNAAWPLADDEQRWHHTQTVICGPLFSAARWRLIPGYIFPERRRLPEASPRDAMRRRLEPVMH